MQIGGLQKTTLVDFPGKVAATVFTRGCSFHCPFCHNPELVIPEKFSGILFDEGELLKFLKKRFGKLEGVCITGGEPTIQPDLLSFIAKLKGLGYAIKLDTNGWDPGTLKKIIDSGKVDYIAMDIKAPLAKYALATGTQVNKEDIKKSISFIMHSGLDYEFRTTVCHPIHEIEDFKEIGRLIKSAKRYFIQNFVHSKHNDEKIKFKPFTEQELKKASTIMSNYIKEIKIR